MQDVPEVRRTVFRLLTVKTQLTLVAVANQLPEEKSGNNFRNIAYLMYLKQQAMSSVIFMLRFEFF
jgi:hypothetical protein